MNHNGVSFVLLSPTLPAFTFETIKEGGLCERQLSSWERKAAASGGLEEGASKDTRHPERSTRMTAVAAGRKAKNDGRRLLLQQ